MKSSFLIIALTINLLSVGYASVENQPIASQEQRIDSTIDYSRQVRIDTALTTKEQEEREKVLFEKACDGLPSFVSDSLENGVRQFLQKNLSSNLDQYDIVDVHTTEFFGKSEATVFLIKDQSGHLCHVVKAFQEPRSLTSRYLKEISAIDHIKQLKMPGVLPIEQTAFALCHDGQKEWGLLLESPASGKRLDQYIQDACQEAIGSEKRKERIETAKKAFKRMGTSLGYLHSKRAPSATPPPPITTSKYDTKLASILKNDFVMNEMSKHFAVSDFENYINDIKNKALAVPLHYTFVHGDAHLGNVFYDEAQDSCTFIDLAGVHTSVDIHDLPILHGAIDLVRVDDSLRFKANNLLINEELTALRSSFYEGYLEVGGQIPDERVLNFYNTFVKLRRLISKSGYVTEPDPRIQASDKLIFEDALHFFEENIDRQ